jgi:hypothetical protein
LSRTEEDATVRAFARLLGFVSVTAMLFTFSACSGKKEEGKGDGVNPDHMAATGTALVMFCNTENKGPEDIDELTKRWGSDLPKGAIEKIRSGDIVVPWKVNLNKLGKTPEDLKSYVILYEKDAPTKGGYVMMGIENPKKVTAEEFKSLKLAHKDK